MTTLGATTFKHLPVLIPFSFLDCLPPAALRCRLSCASSTSSRESAGYDVVCFVIGARIEIVYNTVVLVRKSQDNI